MENSIRKKVFYLAIMVFGSFFLFLQSTSLNNNTPNFSILFLPVSAFVFAIFFDPLIFLVKRYIFRKESNIPYSKKFWLELVENAFAYWVIFSVLSLIRVVL
jgi:hypothetical protein